jgi:manganese-dependent inorganic pyrophosphatase
MSDIYVCGHRNPDTDSIVASMAYANLRNALGDREYKAVRIGAINDETQRMLDRFGFEPPMYIQNMRAQVSDLDFDRPPELNSSVTLDLAWRSMRDAKLSAIPILNDDGTLYGMLSTGDIAAYELSNVFDCQVEELPLFNLISVLEGRLVNEYSNITETISGKVTIALPKAFDDASFTSKDSILICGDQPEIIQRALEAGVGCLILCQTEVAQELADCTLPTCIISTPLNARQVARLIFQGIPVSRFCQTEGLISFHLTDYVDDVRETLINNRYHYYPVLDENENVVGTL